MFSSVCIIDVFECMIYPCFQVYALSNYVLQVYALSMISSVCFIHVFECMLYPCFQVYALSMFSSVCFIHVFKCKLYPCFQVYALSMFSSVSFIHVFKCKLYPCFQVYALSMFSNSIIDWWDTLRLCRQSLVKFPYLNPRYVKADVFPKQTSYDRFIPNPILNFKTLWSSGNLMGKK